MSTEKGIMMNEQDTIDRLVELGIDAEKVQPGKYWNLAWADLARADLAGADLAGANLTWADLAGANLTGANLFMANLAGADLAGANLAGANLLRADLAWADLDGADLSDTCLSPKLTTHSCKFAKECPATKHGGAHCLPNGNITVRRRYRIFTGSYIHRAVVVVVCGGRVSPWNLRCKPSMDGTGIPWQNASQMLRP